MEVQGREGALMTEEKSLNHISLQEWAMKPSDAELCRRKAAGGGGPWQTSQEELEWNHPESVCLHEMRLCAC